MKSTARVIALLLVVVFSAPSTAHAGSTVPYKNQKAGQFCKTADLKKTVKLPDGRILKCLMNGSRARWKG